MRVFLFILTLEFEKSNRSDVEKTGSIISSPQGG